ncbi:uncharacterized protein LOC116286639 [Actinia tenebrosa]|uniref:Uncharacterized protein LOC116286639 n=1 Tax=Actinia tenebrosa TaxID=6105 RepID=A0A6P8H0Z9_ACTTE|nr:uncharacterized protein LOC116286639 [Actinia tenebrosa]
MTGKYLFKIREENRLPQVSVQKVAQATSELLTVAMKGLKRKVDEILTDHNVGQLHEIDEAFEDCVTPFQHLKTTWMLSQFQDKMDSYVEPKRIILNSTRVYKKVKNKYKCMEVEKDFYYVSILKTLQEQLQFKDILQMVFSNSASCLQNNEYLEDFDQGLLVKKMHPLFSYDDSALKLLIYYDDVNIVNPMTNKAHQLGFFY